MNQSHHSQYGLHDVLLERDSCMRFLDRSYRTKLPLPGLKGATAFVPGSSAHPQSFHILYAGDTGITSSRDHRLVDDDLVRSNGAPALAGWYLINMLHAASDFSPEERLVQNDRQHHSISRHRGSRPRCLAWHLP